MQTRRSSHEGYGSVFTSTVDAFCRVLFDSFKPRLEGISRHFHHCPAFSVVDTKTPATTYAQGESIVRAQEIILVERVKHTVTCDFCSERRVTTTHKGYAPTSDGIRVCHVCSKDICIHHTSWFQDDPGSDHFDAKVCPDCLPQFQAAWDQAQQEAGRHDIIIELVDKILKRPGTPSERQE
jgi:hypothetical protein